MTNESGASAIREQRCNHEQRAREPRRLLTTLVTPVLLTLALGACQSVPPWDRGNLAKPQMGDDPNPAQRRVADHIYRSREAGAAGATAEGGGCGCY